MRGPVWRVAALAGLPGLWLSSVFGDARLALSSPLWGTGDTQGLLPLSTLRWGSDNLVSKNPTPEHLGDSEHPANGPASSLGGRLRKPWWSTLPSATCCQEGVTDSKTGAEWERPHGRGRLQMGCLQTAPQTRPGPATWGMDVAVRAEKRVGRSASSSFCVNQKSQSGLGAELGQSACLVRARPRLQSPA